MLQNYFIDGTIPCHPFTMGEMPINRPQTPDAVRTEIRCEISELASILARDTADLDPDVFEQ